MPYQNNNNRITPKSAGKVSSNPVTKVNNLELRYQPDYREAQKSQNLAESLAAIGKGIIGFEQSGILQRKAQEEAIELASENVGDNALAWKKAQKKIKGLDQFNPYNKPAYQNYVLKDFYNKAKIELNSDPDFYKRDKEYIDKFITQKEADFKTLIQDNDIPINVAGSYIEAFRNDCNSFYSNYVDKNTKYTLDKLHTKIQGNISKDMRVGWYNVPKDQQGVILNDILKKYSAENPSIPEEDLIQDFVKGLTNSVIAHEGTIDQAYIIASVKGLSLNGKKLTDVIPDVELTLRDTFKNAFNAKYQEQVLRDNLEEQQLKKATKAAEKDFYTTLINNPEADLVDVAQELVTKYGIEENYGAFLNTIVGLKDKSSKLDDVDSDIDTLKYFDTQLGLEQLDRNELTQAMMNGTLSRKDYYHILDRDIKRETKINTETDKANKSAYEATFKEVKGFGDNIDTKKALRNISTQDRKSTAYADYMQGIASVNTAVANGEISIQEGSKRLNELKDFYNEKYILKSDKQEFTPVQLLKRAYRDTLNPLKEASYDEKKATKAFKELGLIVSPFSPKITSGIKDKRTVKLKDGTTKTSSHQAYDLRAGVGTGIRMPKHSSGSIIVKGTHKDMGNYALVQMDKSGDYMLLLHLNKLPKWNVGESIPANYPLALTGDTGAVEAPHLDVSFYRADGKRRLSVEDFTGRLTQKNNK